LQRVRLRFNIYAGRCDVLTQWRSPQLVTRFDVIRRV